MPLANVDDHAESFLLSLLLYSPYACFGHYEAHIANTGHYIQITTNIHTNRIIAQLEEIVGKGPGSMTA